MNIKYYVVDAEVQILSVSGGWTTVKFIEQQGVERKVRNSAITTREISEDTMKTTPDAVAVAVAETPVTEAAAVDTPAKPKRVALVGVGVLAGRMTKIKDVSVDLGKYVVAEEVTASGRHVIDVGDDVATQLRGIPLDEAYEMAARETERPVEELKTQYGHLNPGMQRMNLGNRIRGAESAKAKAAAKLAAKGDRELAAKQRAEAKAAKAEAAKAAKAAKAEAAQPE